jgi:hypothetical protein
MNKVINYFDFKTCKKNYLQIFCGKIQLISLAINLVCVADYLGIEL